MLKWFGARGMAPLNLIRADRAFEFRKARVRRVYATGVGSRW
jgi:hypothetical protein